MVVEITFVYVYSMDNNNNNNSRVIAVKKTCVVEKGLSVKVSGSAGKRVRTAHAVVS